MSNGNIIISPSNNWPFTDTVVNDFVIFPDSNIQRIQFGTCNTIPALLTLSSNTGLFNGTLDATILRQGGINVLTTAGGTLTGTLNGTTINAGTALQTNGVTRLDSSGILQNIFNFVGIVLPFAGTSAPSGWLFCFGQSLSRTGIYADLFAVIGTTYGSVDASSFNLPDMRGRVPVGKDDMGGSSANRITSAVCGIQGFTLGAAGGDQRLHAHTHGVTDPGHAHGVGYWNLLANSGGQYEKYLRDQGANYANTSTTGSTTGISIQTNTEGGTAQNVPPSIILNYIIKF
jgi:microcystin-dependent protein